MQVMLAFLSPEHIHTGHAGSERINDKSHLATVASAEIAVLNLFLYQSLSVLCLLLLLSLLMLFTIFAISNV